MHRPYSRLLILDEPANHLIDSRAALIEAIHDYRGAVILASHDKHLLDGCVEICSRASRQRQWQAFERILIAAEEKWLRLAGDLNAARERITRGPAAKI